MQYNANPFHCDFLLDGESWNGILLSQSVRAGQTLHPLVFIQNFAQNKTEQLCYVAHTNEAIKYQQTACQFESNYTNSVSGNATCGYETITQKEENSSLDIFAQELVKNLGCSLILNSLNLAMQTAQRIFSPILPL